MGLLDAYKIKKSLVVLLASQDATSPQTAQALSRLKEIGRPALAKFVEALGSAKHPESIEELLTVFLDNETFPFFVHHLAHPNPQVATGIARVFVKGTKYDPNRLLTLFADVKIPKAALGRILAQRKAPLHLKSLMALLGTADRDGRAVLLRLIQRSATASMLPDLMRATRSEDPTIREGMARTLARFSTAAVRETLSGLLNDPHREVRQAALTGLASLQIPLDVRPICQMLRDPHPAVQRQAKEILIQVSDVQTMPYLIDLLQDAAAEVRQRAVDVLNAVPDSAPIRALLHALKDQEWWVQVRACEALRSAGASQLFAIVLPLLKDEAAYIRSSAIEIVKQDHRVFNYVVKMLGDLDAGVRARAVEALVSLEDKRAVPVFLRLLRGTPEVGILVIPALAKCGDYKAISPLLECLQGAHQALHKAALRALVTLTDAAHAAQVFKVVMAVRDTADTALKEVANSTASALIGKFGGAAVGLGTQSAITGTTVWPRQSLLHAPRRTGISGMPESTPRDLKVVDFGLAAVNRADARLTRTGVLVGTPMYMAPEQVRARTIDARTDMYSLGVIMYEVFTGQPPYVADDPMAILFQHVEGNPTPPRHRKPDMPPGLEAIILKAMCIDPARRFQSMDDVRKSIIALSKQAVRS